MKDKSVDSKDLISLQMPSYIDILTGVFPVLDIPKTLDKYKGSEERGLEFVKNITASYLKDLYRILEIVEVRAIQRIIRRGGYIVEGDNEYPSEDVIQSLFQRALLFKSSVDNKEVIVSPLEVCFGIPIEKEDRLTNLIMAFNRYSSDFIKLIASHIGIMTYNKYHKISLAVVVYRELIRNFPKSFESLDDDALFILEQIFLSRYIFNDRLKEIVNSHRPHIKSHSRFTSSILYYLSSPSNRSLKDNNLGDYEKILINLILKGLIIVHYREIYSSDFAYAIPKEALPFVKEFFLKNMDGKKAVAERNMYCPAPQKIVSYSSRVVEDIIKIQIALTIGLIELLKNDYDFKKRSITKVAQLLDTNEAYAQNLLTTLGLLYKKIDYDGLGILRSWLFKEEYKKELLEILLKIDRWALRTNLLDYIANERELMNFRYVPNREELNSLIDKLILLGILDSSEDGKVLKPSTIISSILSKKSYERIQVIEASKKPMVVQANLEIIVPFNIEITLIHKLSTFADIRVLDKMLHFSINKKSMMRALDLGWNKTELINFMESHSLHPIPNAVIQFITDTFESSEDIEIIPVKILIRCKKRMYPESLLSIKKSIKALKGTEGYYYSNDISATELIQMLKKSGFYARIKEDDD